MEFEEQFGISDLAGDDDFGDMEAEHDYLTHAYPYIRI